jgi:hypothetical protein
MQQLLCVGIRSLKTCNPRQRPERYQPILLDTVLSTYCQTLLGELTGMRKIAETQTKHGLACSHLSKQTMRRAAGGIRQDEGHPG